MAATGRGRFSIVIVKKNVAKTKATQSYTVENLEILLVRERSLTAKTAKEGRKLLRDKTECTIASVRSTRRYVGRGVALEGVTERYIRRARKLFLALPRSSLTCRTGFIRSYRTTNVGTRIVSPGRTLVVRPSTGPSLVKTMGIPSNTISPFELASTGIVSTGLRKTGILICDRIAELVGRKSAMGNIRVCGGVAGRGTRCCTPVAIGTNNV